MKDKIENEQIKGKTILNLVYVMTDGLGDAAISAKYISQLKKSLKGIKDDLKEKKIDTEYSIVNVIICDEGATEKVKSILKKEKVLSEDEQELGSSIHLIASQYGVDNQVQHASVWADGCVRLSTPECELVLEKHANYLKENPIYQQQLQQLALVNTLMTDFSMDVFFVLNGDQQNEDRLKTLYSNIIRQITQSTQNKHVPVIRIAEAGVASGFEMNSSYTLTSQLAGNPLFLNMLKQDLGWSKIEHGVLLDEEENAHDAQVKPEEFFLKILKDKPCAGNISNVFLQNESASVKEFINDCFIMPAYAKREPVVLYAAQVAAESKLVQQKKTLLLFSNKSIEEFQSALNNSQYNFADKRIEFIDYNSNEVKVIPGDKEPTIKIVCNVFLSAEDHQKLFQLSSGLAVCTGDTSFAMCLDSNHAKIPLNDLRKHKMSADNNFISAIESLGNKEENKPLIEFLDQWHRCFSLYGYGVEYFFHNAYSNLRNEEYFQKLVKA